jgi:mRNA interferase MazF
LRGREGTGERILHAEWHTVLYAHIRVSPPEGGLRKESAVLCEAIRSVSRERLSIRLGAVGGSTLIQVEDVVRILLGL